MLTRRPWSTTPAAQSLTLAAGPFWGSPTASVVFGDGQAVTPTITSACGFNGYRPVAEIAPRSSDVIVLDR